MKTVASKKLFKVKIKKKTKLTIKMECNIYVQGHKT